MGRAGPGARWRALTAAGALLVAGLAGCDGGDAPTPAPLEPLTSSASPTGPSESPAPTMPAEAQTNSLAGAKAFARYWIAALNRAIATGQTSEIRANSEGCKACVAIAEFLEEVYTAGGHIESDGWAVEKVAKPVKTPTGVVFVDALVDGSPQRIVRPGEPVAAYPGGKSVKSFQLKWQGQRWSIIRLDQT